MKNRKKEVQRENNFSLDKYLTGLYHVDTNQRWRRVASEGTAKGAAESGTAARAADVNGLRRALRKRKPVGSDGQPLPLSPAARITMYAAERASRWEAKLSGTTEIPPQRTDNCALGRFS